MFYLFKDNLGNIYKNKIDDIIKPMKTNTNYTFRIIIEPDEKGMFHGYVPALSGCHTFGATIKETRKNLKDAISVYVSSLITDGEKVSKDNNLSSLDIWGDEGHGKKLLILQKLKKEVFC